MNKILVWIPLGVIAALMVVFAVALFDDEEGGADPMAGRPLPDLPLTEFRGGAGGFEPETIEGPYLLNLWASWCAPCIVEHPVLTELADQGVPIYGIVYKDEPADARAFLTRLGDPFAGLAADPEGRAALELGVTGAPETLLIDAEGVIRARWRGAIDAQIWERTFEDEWREAGGAPVNAGALEAAG
ncbi:MAG: DsbE family thiol:disulfide interchange protein [Oceanicaulis sp.]